MLCARIVNLSRSNCVCGGNEVLRGKVEILFQIFFCYKLIVCFIPIYWVHYRLMIHINETGLPQIMQDVMFMTSKISNCSSQLLVLHV